MRFFSTIVAAALVAFAAAQSSVIKFTSTPTAVEAGKTYTLTWTTTDSTDPVTITIRYGSQGALSTGPVLTTSATGGSYQWTVDKSLETRGDYALEITQGNQNNYSGQFPLTGGAAAGASSSASAMSMTGSMMTMTASGSSMPTMSASATKSGSSSSASKSGSMSATGTSSSSTGAPTSGASDLKSPMALMFGAVAAIAYFN